MTFSVSARLKQFMAEGWDLSNKNPFYDDKGLTRARFDEIKFSVSAPGLVKLSFYWQGAEYFFIERSMGLAVGDSLTFGPIEASVGVTLGN